jgi:hypothetical protein
MHFPVLFPSLIKIDLRLVVFILELDLIYTGVMINKYFYVIC